MSKLNSNLMEEKKRGFFLVIEGISKSGKQSQADLLEKFLINSKQKVKVIRKKSKFPIAAENINVTEKIENLKEMKYRARHMLYVYNLWQMREDILRDLAEGITVIFINYCYCNVAAGLQKQLTWEFLTLPCQGLVRPDLGGLARHLSHPQRIPSWIEPRQRGGFRIKLIPEYNNEV